MDWLQEGKASRQEDKPYSSQQWIRWIMDKVWEKLHATWRNQGSRRASRTPRWHCERWFRISRYFYRARIISVTNDGSKSNGWHSKTGCAGQAADAVSAYTQVKMEDAPTSLKIPKSERPDIWIRLPKHKSPKTWSSMEDPVVPLERDLYGHLLAGLLCER